MPTQLMYSTQAAEYRHYLTRAAALRGKDAGVPLRGTNVQTQSPLLAIEVALLEDVERIAIEPHSEQDARERLLLRYCEAAARLAQVWPALKATLECYVAVMSGLASRPLEGDAAAFQNVSGREMNDELEQLEQRAAVLRGEIRQAEDDLGRVSHEAFRLEKRLVSKRSELENLKLLCGEE